MPPDLTEAEKAVLIDLVVGAIESGHFPMSERAQRLRAILVKLREDLAPVTPELDEQTKPPASAELTRARRR
jgi:hypothetical protein